MGCSVIKVKALKVPIIKFTHNSWTMVRGTSSEETSAMQCVGTSFVCLFGPGQPHGPDTRVASPGFEPKSKT